jgi:hypothetical protein
LILVGEAFSARKVLLLVRSRLLRYRLTDGWPCGNFIGIILSNFGEIVAINPKDTVGRKAAGKFARALLATTCLTVATGGAALASTVNIIEGTAPAPVDFANTFGSASSFSAAIIPGTTTVSGSVSGGDQLDYIELTGLGTGSFSVTFEDTGSINSTGAATLLTDGGLSLGGPTIFTSAAPAIFASQLIPSDQNLILEIQERNESTAPYTVTVTTTAAAAPEPGTIALAGLGLAGAALARKRRKQ